MNKKTKIVLIWVILRNGQVTLKAIGVAKTAILIALVNEIESIKSDSIIDIDYFNGPQKIPMANREMANAVNPQPAGSNKRCRKSLYRIVLLNWILLQLMVLVSVVGSDPDVIANIDETTDIQDGQVITDQVDDSFYGPLQPDPDSCDFDKTADGFDASCWRLPGSAIEEEEVVVTSKSTNIQSALTGVSCSYGGYDPDAELQDNILQQCTESSFSTYSHPPTTKAAKVVDKHWGSDPNILRMRDRLRSTGSGESMKRHLLRKIEMNSKSDRSQTAGTSDKEKDEEISANQNDEGKYNGAVENHRPPIFLLPGLASTRLVAWRPKACKLSEIKVQDPVWLNINLVLQMSTIDVECFSDCLKLGWNQTDTDDLSIGCKLRPDEGLDAISSLSPGGIGPQLLGGTNTVYAWLIQWLADNLGYDVTNIIGLPYDWRLSPDKMESRDGFLTFTRRRIEAAVQSNGGEPGIIVAHSMGNLIFRYFLNWLRSQLRQEAYNRYAKQAERRRKKQLIAKAVQTPTTANSSSGRKTGSSFGFEETWQNHSSTQEDDIHKKRLLLKELAVIEGDEAWYEWIEAHIWTYVGLSAPLLGAVNPLRSVLSGENMGLPIANDAARFIELTFGSTHTVNPVSTQEGFCDDWKPDEWGEEPNERRQQRHADSKLACMDDVVSEIESIVDHRQKKEPNPWADFPALERLIRKRADWDSDIPLIRVVTEYCGEKEKPPCAEKNVTAYFGPLEVQNGNLFTKFSQIWKEKEDPLVIKYDQLKESFWDTGVRSMLNETWERPLIKHVVMAYGIDIPTEVGYEYRKTEKINKEDKVASVADERKKADTFDGVPPLSAVIFETEGGQLVERRVENRGLLGDLLSIKRTKEVPLKQGTFHHSGDGSVPYLSLAWAHTWLLHAGRALLYSKQNNVSSPYWEEKLNGSTSTTTPLDDIKVSHRPKGATEWKDGPPPMRLSTLGEKKVEESSDTGTYHPHGTKYKPEMIRYHNRGTSRTTGIEYTTTIIEAIGVEHKETTRNYDILAAVFTDVMKCMHDDFNIV